MDIARHDQHSRTEVRSPTRFRAEFDSTWTPCRVIDISSDGAALALPAGAPAPTGVVIVEVLLTDDRARISLRAEVRNNVQTPQGFERVGVKFVSPASLERRVLNRLLNGTLPDAKALEHLDNARRD